MSVLPYCNGADEKFRLGLCPRTYSLTASLVSVYEVISAGLVSVMSMTIAINWNITLLLVRLDVILIGSRRDD